MNTQGVVWHYTYDQAMQGILKSGAVLPPSQTPGNSARSMGVTEKEFARQSSYKGFQIDTTLVLFSERDDWERASYRTLGNRATGNEICLTRLEDYTFVGWNVFRIGVHHTSLLPYKQLLRSVCMPMAMERRLDHRSWEIGANPKEWWGTNQPVPRHQWLAIQRYDSKIKEWIELEPSFSDWADGSVPIFIAVNLRAKIRGEQRRDQ